MIDFVPLAGVALGVKEDVEFLKTSPLILPQIEVTGWIYDVESGSTTRVV